MSVKTPTYTDPYAFGSDTYTSYLQLHPGDRVVVASSQHNDDRTQSPAEYHGRVRVYSVEARDGNIPDAVEVSEYLASDEGQGLLGRICDGFEVYWDGNNNRGRLGDDARTAEQALQAALHDLEGFRDLAVWDAGDWLIGNADASDFGITAETTDEEIGAIARAEVDEAKGSDALLDVGDVEQVMRDWRDELAGVELDH